MRKTMIVVAGVLLAGVAACAPQPGYGPGYGYGQSYGYGPSYGYGQPYSYYGQPAYSQPAPNPLAQMIGAMMTSGGGGFGNSGYYQPAPYPSYGGWR